MRRMLLAGCAAVLCAISIGTGTAAATEVGATINLDYSYDQDNVGGDVNAATFFNQKYEIKYETSLSTAHDFIGAVRLELQDAWYTDASSTSKISPTLEMQARGSQVLAKLAYETVISSTDSYHETGEVTAFSNSISLNLEMTPVFLPEWKLKLQRKRNFEENFVDGTTSTFEFSARKDIYGVRLEYNFKHQSEDEVLPTRSGSADNQWSTKVAYKEILWGGTEFELAYELAETYKDEQTRGVFTGETANYDQTFKTRLRNSLQLGPRAKLGMQWEYQFDQDLLSLDYDYHLQNKYVLDLRWDTYDWLKITSEAGRETELDAAVAGEEDERKVTDQLKVGFDFSKIPWMRVSGKAELKSEDQIAAGTGGSVDKVDTEQYELIAKNKIGGFWDFTWKASTGIEHTDGLLSQRETKIKADLRLRLLDLMIIPEYEVSRTNEWERLSDDPVSQKQVRQAKIKFEYKMQLVDLFKATFSHQYDIKVDDMLDEVLNFERKLQFNENTKLNVLLIEIVRDVRLESEVNRKASDTEGDPDPQLVELSYTLKLDWKYRQLTVLSSIKYNDKGDSFDDVSFNAKATWKGEQLEVTGEYQFDKIINDNTEPKDEKRKFGLKLNYRF